MTAFFVAAMLQPATARGVIIDTLTGAGNTSSPIDDPGWANVGTTGNGSAVYLGNRWAITASHVVRGDTTFSGTTYQIVPGSAVTLTNNGAAGKTALTDLVLYQISADPGLPSLTIASSTPGAASPVTMIGAGRDRGAFESWLVNTGTTPWVWTVNNTNPNAAGYFWGTGRTMRWGTNAIDGDGWIDYTIGNLTSVYAVQTTFTASGSPSTEAQAAPGDSGGAVFHKNGSLWELAGLMVVTDAYSGQPGSTAVYGNNTYSADLSYYRSQIMAVVPEPGSIALAAIGSAALLVATRCFRSGLRKPNRVSDGDGVSW